MSGLTEKIEYLENHEKNMKNIKKTWERNTQEF